MFLYFLTTEPGSPGSPFLPRLPRFPGGPGGPITKRQNRKMSKEM